MPTELDTPENRLSTTDVTFLRRRIVGAYLRWPQGALPLIYDSNMQISEIRRFTNVLAPGTLIYAVYVGRTPDVKLFPIYEAQLMQRYGPGNSRRILRRLRSST